MEFYMFMSYVSIFIDWLNYVASYNLCFHTKYIPLLSLRKKPVICRCVESSLQHKGYATSQPTLSVPLI